MKIARNLTAARAMSADMQVNIERVIAQVAKVRELLTVIADESESQAKDRKDPDPLRVELASAPTAPVSWLAERLGLTATEQHMLWVLIAHELCPVARYKVREINTEHIVDPTIDTLRRSVYGDKPNMVAWRELGVGGALRRSVLVELVDQGPEHRQTVKLARRVLALVHGEVGLDDEMTYAAFDDAGAQLDELEIDSAARSRLTAAFDGKGLVIVKGGAGSGRRSAIAAIARTRGKRVLAVDGMAIAKERDKAARQLRVVARECARFEAGPVIRQLEALGGAGEVPDRMDLVESELGGLCFATTTRAIVRRWRRPPVHVELPPLGGAARARLWAKALPVGQETAEQLANLYPLEIGRASCRERV